MRLSIDWYRDGEPRLFLRTGLGRGKGGGDFGTGVERSDSEVEEWSVLELNCDEKPLSTSSLLPAIIKDDVVNMQRQS